MGFHVTVKENQERTYLGTKPFFSGREPVYYRMET